MSESVKATGDASGGLLRRKEAAALASEFLQERGYPPVSQQKLAHVAWLGGGPRLRYFGQGARPTPFYARNDVLAWAASLVPAPVRCARDIRAARREATS